MRTAEQIILEAAREAERATPFQSEQKAFIIGSYEATIRRLVEELKEKDNSSIPLEKGVHYVDASLEDEPIVLEVDYSPGRPGVHTLRNGDPGYPDEPAECTVCGVQIRGLSLDIGYFDEGIVSIWTAHAEEAITTAAEEARQDYYAERARDDD